MCRLIFTFIICLFSISTFACSCWGPNTFCDYASQEAYWAPTLVVKGTKIRNVDHGMDFEITEIYKGEESRKVIRIWGDLGWLCRWYASSFADGEEYYFALHQLFEDTENPRAFANPIPPLEKDADYYITFCGKSYWHKSEEGTTDEPESEILECLNQFPPKSTVTIPSTSDNDFCDVNKSELFPNPTSRKFYINLPDKQELTRGTARIFDDCGKLVYQIEDINQIYSSGLFSFRIKTLQPGLYFLDLNLPELCESNLTRRFAVN